MIRVRRNSRLPGVVLSVLVLSSVGLLAPASAPGVRIEGAQIEGVQEKNAAERAVLPAAADKTVRSLTDSLEALAAREPSPNRAMIRDAFTAAGFAGESVEISLDVTPTGLAVDSIRGAAAEQGSCTFGEVREGQVSVSVLPVLASGYCFVGDQR
ncbi:DUF6993 domain-containing protein [Arthrobacter sp. NPDC097144]|uniref:DUF6993 domain-containing protein n=1 Tax=Arthrobacter sp. NPDC097144 TaxID=3363946 RepID=UPI0037FB511D